MLIDLFLTLAAGYAVLLVFLFYWRKGQFDDAEDIKYQMFRDENEEP